MVDEQHHYRPVGRALGEQDQSAASGSPELAENGAMSGRSSDVSFGNSDARLEPGSQQAS